MKINTRSSILYLRRIFRPLTAGHQLRLTSVKNNATFTIKTLTWYLNLTSPNQHLLPHTHTHEDTLDAAVILHELTIFYISVLVAVFFNGKINEFTKTMQKYIRIVPLRIFWAPPW